MSSEVTKSINVFGCGPSTITPNSRSMCLWMIQSLPRLSTKNFPSLTVGHGAPFGSCRRIKSFGTFEPYSLPTRFRLVAQVWLCIISSLDIVSSGSALSVTNRKSMSLASGLSRCWRGSHKDTCRRIVRRGYLSH